SLGSVQLGSVVSGMQYDGAGRRIVQDVQNSGDLDLEYHYYYQAAGDGLYSLVEVRNGSDMVLKQNTWGLGYVDELLQVSVNSAPTTQDDCDVPYWALQNANFNVMALI